MTQSYRVTHCQSQDLGLSLPQEVQYQSVFAVFAIDAKITIF